MTPCGAASEEALDKLRFLLPSGAMSVHPSSSSSVHQEEMEND